MEENHSHSHYHGVDRAEEHVSVADALKILLNEIRKTRSEEVKLSESDNRVLLKDLASPKSLPRLARSTRDGYAIKLSGDMGVADNQPFKIVGEIRIGVIPKLTIRAGEAARIPTGAYIPPGANTVVMIEYAEVDRNSLSITKPAKIGENILSPGQDLRKGETLFNAGTRLRPQHIALLSMLGINRFPVYVKPRVAFFSTGDELEDIGSSWGRKVRSANQVGIFDSNRPFLSSIINELGGIPIDLGIARDNLDEVKAKMIEGLKYDALFLSAGTSVGERDYVTKATESIKGVRILVHGVAMRPSSPTGLAVYRGKPLILLPGFPTSAIVSFFVFGRPAILKLGGSSSLDYPMIRATIDDDYDGKAGLTHFLRVRISRDGEKYNARIVRPTEAQFSSWLREANGIAVIGRDGKTSVRRGDEISAFLIGEIT
jgi:molybdenum cofactor synthesis domain-containing protein